MLASPVSATWTIVAVDPETQEVGIAGASCTAFVAGVARLVPGHGAVVAQARSDMEAKEKAADMMALDRPISTILATITDPAFDSMAQDQQYGLAVLRDEGEVPGAAAFTGSETHGSRGQSVGPRFAVQGNILANDRVVQASYDAYLHAEAGGLPLAERLMRAREAGADAGGDRRCGPEKTAQSAYLGVGVPSDTPRELSLKLIVGTNRDSDENPGGRAPQTLPAKPGTTLTARLRSAAQTPSAARCLRSRW